MNRFYLALVGLLLTLHAHANDYWFKDHAPVEVQQVIYAEYVFCPYVDPHFWGCADRQTGTIFVSTRAPWLLWECIAKHEKMHLDGYSHVTPDGPASGVWCDLTTYMHTPSF